MSDKLYRSKKNRVLGGVAGGLGEHLDIEPVILRVIFVVLFLAGGSGFLVYLIFWIIVPEQPAEFDYANHSTKDKTMSEDDKTFAQDAKPNEDRNRQSNGSLIGGVILITLGALFLVDRFIPRIDFGDLWPVLLVVIGIGLVYKGAKEKNS